MAHYTYGPFPLPYADAVATIYDDATGALATLFDSFDNPVSVPSYDGLKLYFRVEEGTYRIVLTHPSQPGSSTTRAVVSADAVSFMETNSPGSTNPGGGAVSDATVIVKGVVKLAGDLGGTADVPTVPALALLSTLQPLDDDLTTFSALDSSTAGVPASDGSGWVKKTYAQLKTALGLAKTDVGLGNVDNTADTDKPVSTATQTALDLKAPLASPALTGSPTVNGSAVSTAADLATKADLVSGVIPSSQIPALALVTVVPVASQAAMLALTSTQVQPGDLATRTDGAGTFILTDPDPSLLAHWTLLNAPTDVVISVNGLTGTVVLAKGDVGLGSVDNTADTAKPVSTAQQTALDTKLQVPAFGSTGTLTVKVGAGRYYVEQALTIVSVQASVGTAPTGASVIVDVNKNGTTIFTTQANRPTIAASANTSGNVTNQDVTTIAAGDYLTVDVDQVGSTVAGSDLVVQVRLR